MKPVTRWLPAGLLALGVVLLAGGVTQQRAMPLRIALDQVVPRTFDGRIGEDIEIEDEVQEVAGMSSYVLRRYPDAADATLPAWSVYVGYYPQQSQGETIHSPKNCLPGGGWEPLTSSRETVPTPVGPAHVNRYLIGKGQAKAVVLYWYQGRGRTAANEYVVKWDLLRDQALMGRSDEAMARVIVPVVTTEAAAYEQAARMAAALVPQIDRALSPREL